MLNDNEYALPRAAAFGPAGDYDPGQPGMTLRDYFAGVALQGLVWMEPTPYVSPPAPTPREATKLGVAQIAYEYADAMLQARNMSEAEATVSKAKGGGHA